MSAKKPIKKAIVDMLVNSEAASSTILDFTYHPYKYIYTNLQDEYGYRKSSLSNSLKRMQDKGLLEKQVKDDGEVLIKLTDQAKVAIMKDNLKSIDTQLNEGNYILVVFDIPEISKTVRNLLRRNLKEFGFEQLQKSVWVTKKDMFDPIKSYFDKLNLAGKVLVLESKRTSFII